MSQADADRNLLLGVLALQLGFIGQEDLVAAVRTWAGEKARPLGDVLLELGALDAEGRDLLVALVRKRLERPSGGASPLLASTVRDPRSVQVELRGIEDPEVGQAVARLMTPGTEDSVNRGLTVQPWPGPLPGGGRFRKERFHARGGQGEVWVARDEELGREVALKGLRPQHADDPIYRARFLREARLTGRLQHPNIVPVYGLDADADGRPVYGMRFVEGQSLGEALEDYHRGRAARDPSADALAFRKLLGRFVAACRAVAYAHSRGVLHRDLKPGNILLGEFDETLVVDWGLAKQTDQPADDGADEASGLVTGEIEAGLTRQGKALGTPAFMSPEQAAGRFNDVGSASDVYSLGATLYSVLTSRPPFEHSDQRVVLFQVQTGTFARPRELNPRVPRALEAVCLKAMAFRREDRYRTAAELADDVERWLADHPVSAWREPASVRGRRWVARHRTSVSGLAAAAMVALVSFGASTALLAGYSQQLKESNQRLGEQRQTAERERQRAEEAVERFDLEVIEDPVLASVELQPLRERLLGASLTFYSDAAQEPGSEEFSRRRQQAAVFFKLGRVQVLLGKKDAAQRSFRDALARQRDLLRGHDEPAVRADLARTAHHLGTLDEDDKLLWEARDLRADLVKEGRDDPSRTRDLAQSEVALKRLAEAAKLQSDLVESHRGDAAFAGDLALTLRLLGNSVPRDRARDSLPFFREARRIREQLLRNNPVDLKSRDELALIHYHTGNAAILSDQPELARLSFEQALRAPVEFVGYNPNEVKYRHDLARAYHSFAFHRRQLGDWQQALHYYGVARDVREQLSRTGFSEPEFDRYLAMTCNNLAERNREIGALEEARRLFAPALEGRRRLAKLLAPDDRWHYDRQREWADTLHNLGLLHRDAGRPEESMRFYREALAIQERCLGHDPESAEYRRDLARSYLNLGVAQTRAGATGEAGRSLGRARALYDSLAQPHGGGVPSAENLKEWSQTLSHQAVLCRIVGRAQEALSLLESAGKRQRDLIRDHPTRFEFDADLSLSLVERGLTLVELNRAEDARDARREAVEAHAAAGRKAPQMTCWWQHQSEYLDRLHELQRSLGELAGARDTALRRRQLWPLNPRELYKGAVELAGCAALAGQQKNERLAVELRQEALEMLAGAARNGFADRDGMRADGAWAPLSKDPRFVRLQEQVGDNAAGRGGAGKRSTITPWGLPSP